MLNQCFIRCSISASLDLYEALIETVPIYNTTKYSKVVVENEELYSLIIKILTEEREVSLSET